MPDGGHQWPVARPHAHVADHRGGEAGDDHGDHARRPEKELRRQEGGIGERHGQAGLGELRALEPGIEQREQIGEDEAGNGAERKGVEKGQDRSADGDRHVGCQAADQDGKQGNRGGVVQKAFTFQDHQKTFRRAELLEDGDDGRRIGGGNGGAEQQAGDQGQIRNGEQRAAHQDRRRDHGDDRHQHHHRQVFQKPSDVDRKRHFEQQGRQKDVKQALAVDREIVEEPGVVGVESEARKGDAREMGETADRETGDRDHGGQRQAEPFRGRDQQPHQHEPGDQRQKTRCHDVHGHCC